MGQIIGKCRLCLQDGVPLQKSHGLCAAIYKSMRVDSNGGNPNPVVITSRSATQTSKQDTAPLLCRDCEQRFSRNGESWVFGNGLRADGSFPLKAVLDARKPDIFTPNQPTKIFYGANIAELNVEAMTYFAASMFWRFAVHPWKTDGGYSIKLGRYEEQFRQYLLGVAPFPKDAALWVVVRETSPISHLTYFPTSAKFPNMHTHRFPMPGFAFLLYVGKQVPEEFHNSCFVRVVGNPFCQTSILEQHLLEEGMRMAANHPR